MFDDYYCTRCRGAFKWEQMTPTREGNLYCPSCWPRLDPNNEPRRKCPVDGGEMAKELAHGLVIIDRCPACGGTWLDRGEFDVLARKWAEEFGYGRHRWPMGFGWWGF